MKLIIVSMLLVLSTACSTYNIIVVADQPFMDQVKSDYNQLYMTQAIKIIQDSIVPACPLNRELPTWHMRQEN